MAIPYLKGYLIKPSAITTDGVVLFTDGTNEVTPNQQQCEAYGYTYNQETGTCSTYTFTPKLGIDLINESNSVKGAGNSIETGTNNTYIMGEQNTVKGNSRNNIIVGAKNEIVNGVNNANVFGTLGEATASNSIVLGGNDLADNLGERQSIQLMYGVQTTDGTVVNSYLNNLTGSYLAIPDDTIMYFHADVIAVRVGGDGTGNLGDYKSWVERGVVINESKTLSIQRERDTIKGAGTTTGWQPTGAVTGTNFTITCKAANSVTVEWACNITFTQIKTGVAL
jgi:hypothetical protein